MIQLPELSVEICQKCAMKCKHCSSSAGDEIENVLSVKEIMNIIDECVSKLDTYSFSLSGGDPITKGDWDGISIEESDCWRLMKYAKKKGMQILLYTSSIHKIDENGRPIGLSHHHIKKLADEFGRSDEKKYVYDKHINKNKEIPAFKIIFSLHGSEETHDSQMGVEGVYRELMNVIHYCYIEDVYVSIHCVPSGHNYHEILKVIDIAAENHAKEISFLRFVPQGRGLENIDMFKWGKDEFREANRMLLFAKLFRKDIDIRIGEPMDFLFLLDDTQKKKVCDGGIGKILVRPDGDVHVCPAWKELGKWKAGNIRDDNIVNIWYNAKTYKLFREYYDNNKPMIGGLCKDCEYIEKCKGGCTAQRILSSGDIYGSEDPLCFYKYPIIQNKINPHIINRRWNNFIKYIKDENCLNIIFKEKFDISKMAKIITICKKMKISPSNYGFMI